MDHILCPIISHELYHLEKLLEVEVLLICHHVDVLVEIVGLLSVECTGEVSRGIKGSAVRLQYQAGRHSVIFKIHDLGAFAVL